MIHNIGLTRTTRDEIFTSQNIWVLYLRGFTFFPQIKLFVFFRVKTCAEILNIVDADRVLSITVAKGFWLNIKYLFEWIHRRFQFAYSNTSGQCFMMIQISYWNILCPVPLWNRWNSFDDWCCGPQIGVATNQRIHWISNQCIINFIHYIWQWMCLTF